MNVRNYERFVRVLNQLNGVLQLRCVLVGTLLAKFDECDFITCPDHY